MTDLTAIADAPYDPLDPQQLADPAEPLARSRRSCPVSQPYSGVFVLARHGDVQAALAAPEVFSSVDNFNLGGDVTTASLPAPVITTLDPPAHTAVRKRLRRWFMPMILRRQEPRIREIVAEILDQFTAGQSIEAMTEFASKVPTRTVYAFLGLPEQDWEQLQRWSDAIDDILPELSLNMPELQALIGYLGNLVAARAAAPATGADVIDGLVHAADGETALTPVEIVMTLFQLIVAATDTTTSLISNLLYELLTDRRRWERLLADQSLIATAIEESLRHDSPLQYVLRTVTAEREISGCPVSPGNRLVISLQSANWDEQAWGDDAAEFSLDRAPGQAAMMVFGYGIHTCLGAPLARLQARIVLEALLARFPGIRLAPGYQRTPGTSLLTRRPQRLDVIL